MSNLLHFVKKTIAIDFSNEKYTMIIGNIIANGIPMAGQMLVKIFDVEHGQCAMVVHRENGVEGQLAMIDSGCSSNWSPSSYIKNVLKRDQIDYLFITNADQDHMSDLDALHENGIAIKTFTKNPSYTSDQIREIKRKSGPLTKDAERYANMIGSYTGKVTHPFNESMGGIVRTTFYNRYPEFDDTNNLSLVVFLEFEGWVILFPGDLEGLGWKGLLRDNEFCRMLRRTNVLVASHHGRASGFCEEVFEHAQPDVVVISDKAIIHATQETVPDYRRVVDPGKFVRTTLKTRHVLTTRRDGTILFTFENGGYHVDTELRG